MYSACLVLISLLMYMTIQDCLRVCKRTTFPVRVTPVAAQRTEVNRHARHARPRSTTWGIDLLTIGAMGAPVPNQLYVSWDGQPDPVAVPVGP